MTHTFYNHTSATRNGFKHVSTLFIDGRPVASATMYYYNRTWEAYEYRTSMREATMHAMERIEAAELSGYKARHGYKRMTAQRAVAFRQHLQSVPEYAAYEDIYNAL